MLSSSLQVSKAVFNMLTVCYCGTVLTKSLYSRPPNTAALGTGETYSRLVRGSSQQDQFDVGGRTPVYSKF